MKRFKIFAFAAVFLLGFEIEGIFHPLAPLLRMVAPEPPAVIDLTFPYPREWPSIANTNVDQK